MSKKFDRFDPGGPGGHRFWNRKADVAIKGEKIAAVKRGLTQEEASQVIDASGKYVMPGVIDVHVHPVYEDDMGGLSFTAAHGGTTTLIHFAYAKPGMKLIDTIKKYQEEGLQKSYLDFGIHGTLFDPASQIEEIPKAFDLGVSSFKMFMTYAKLKWMTDDYHLTAAMDLIAECGGLAMVHAENGLVTDYLEDRSLKRGEDQKKVFLKTRPDLLEAEAIFRALTIAAITRCPLYIVHLSTAKGRGSSSASKSRRPEGLCGDLSPIPDDDRCQASEIRAFSQNRPSSSDRERQACSVESDPERDH